MSLPLLKLEDGSLVGRPIPISVALADMTGDGLLDIVTMDPFNYIRIFFNQGTAEEPKFATGDIAPFVMRPSPAEPIFRAFDRMYVGWLPYTGYVYGGRICVTDTFATGRKDLVMGNYGGDFFHIKNKGSGAQPVFNLNDSTSAGADLRSNNAFFKDQKIPTQTNRIAGMPAGGAAGRKDMGIKNWGNFVSPIIADIFGRGVKDMISGEGSYSANNIHIFPRASNSNPSEVYNKDHFILAYGDGREWLSPAVVDYYGKNNGKLDLLVSCATGKVSVHLNPGTDWKGNVEPPEFKFKEYLKTTSGSDLSFGGPCTIAVGDLTGNGLFDIIAGKPNGRIAVAYNKGTKEEPKFATPVEIKSTATVAPYDAPNNWGLDLGGNRGNFYCVSDIVKAEEEEAGGVAAGKTYLRVNYRIIPNLVMAQITEAMYPKQTNPDFSMSEMLRYGGSTLNLTSAARTFSVSQGRIALKYGQRYVLTFKYKGTFSNGMTGYHCMMNAGSVWVAGNSRRGPGGRWEHIQESFDTEMSLSSSTSWKEMRKEFTVTATNKQILDVVKDPAKGPGTINVQFHFTVVGALPDAKSDFCITDVSVVPAN